MFSLFIFFYIILSSKWNICKIKANCLQVMRINTFFGYSAIDPATVKYLLSSAPAPVPTKCLAAQHSITMSGHAAPNCLMHLNSSLSLSGCVCYLAQVEHSGFLVLFIKVQLPAGTKMMRILTKPMHFWPGIFLKDGLKMFTLSREGLRVVTQVLALVVVH